MNAKDPLIDFLNYAFLIILIIFCLVFFVVGDRFENFTNILKSLAPLIFFIAIPVLFYKKKRKQEKRSATNVNSFDEVLLYLSSIDKMKDFAAIAVVIVIDFFIAVIGKGFLEDDFLQIFVTLVILLIWNMLLFKKNKSNNLIEITFRKIINDDIVTFAYPIIIYISTYLIGKTPDITDVFQSLTPVIIMYFWHYVLFEKKRFS